MDLRNSGNVAADNNGLNEGTAAMATAACDVEHVAMVIPACDIEGPVAIVNAASDVKGLVDDIVTAALGIGSDVMATGYCGAE